MLFGKSVIWWLLVAFLATCIFFLAQWVIPLLFGLVGFAFPPHITNVIALLVAAGIVYGGYTRS